jgi:4-coumarate--CoA ligase
LKPGSTLDEKQVQDFIQSKVSHHKYLRSGVEFISEIPKSASGKILRRVLRDLDKKTLLKAKAKL